MNKVKDKYEMSNPFDRRPGIVIDVHNEPLITKKDREHIKCYINMRNVNIPLSFFKNQNKKVNPSDFSNTFTSAIYSTTNNVELHQLLQGKSLVIESRGEINTFTVNK